MSIPNPAFAHISRMENDVRDVARWGELLTLVGSTPHMVQPEAIYTLGNTIKELGKRLEAQWDEAFDIAGRQS